MLTQHIALVPDRAGFPACDLLRVSAALQTQVTRDLAPIWGVTATVDPFLELEEVPVGYHPIIVSQAPLHGQAGLHVDSHGQAYAQIEATGEWSLPASRACLELLINPVEQRTVVSAKPRPDRGPLEVLIEISGPTTPEHAYRINDVLVSDFCTPAFFALQSQHVHGFSFAGAIAAPFEVHRGGHLAWYDPISDDWWLRSHWGIHPIDTCLGTLERSALVRELVQACASLSARRWQALEDTAARSHSLHAQASRSRAERLRAVPAPSLDSEHRPLAEALRRRQDMWERIENSIAAAPQPASVRAEWRPPAATIDEVEIELIEDEAPRSVPPAVRTIRPAAPAAAHSRTANRSAIVGGAALIAATLALAIAASRPQTRSAAAAPTAAVTESIRAQPLAAPTPAMPTSATPTPATPTPATPTSATPTPATPPMTVPSVTPHRNGTAHRSRPEAITERSEPTLPARVIAPPAPTANTEADELEALIDTRH